MRSKQVRAVVLTVMLSVGGGVVLASPQASAASFGAHVSGTGGIGLNVRSSPSSSASRVGGLAEGQNVTIDCYGYGDTIAGYWYTGNLWQHITSPISGWVTDTYVYTGYNGPIPGEPQCGATPPPPPPPAQPNQFYNRSAARSWALNNAKALHNSLAAACTWFVSNALWSGGFPKDSTWTSSGSHGYLPGSVTAWAAPNLINYLSQRYSISKVAMSFSANKVPAAQVGDFVAYDWDGNGTTDHVAFIVDIASGQYPEVAEWGVGGITTLGTTPYKERGWTYSQLHNEWLQKEYPNVKATLIHINGGHY